MTTNKSVFSVQRCEHGGRCPRCKNHFQFRNSWTAQRVRQVIKWLARVEGYFHIVQLQAPRWLVVVEMLCSHTSCWHRRQSLFTSFRSCFLFAALASLGNLICCGAATKLNEATWSLSSSGLLEVLHWVS